MYSDGTDLAQYDEKSPLFLGEPGLGEVPYRAIEWNRVESLRLESQYHKSEFSIIQPPEGYKISLRRRAWGSAQGDETMVFMIVVSVDGVEVDDQSTAHVTYWFPNGVVHDCPRFNCPDVAKYASGMLHGIPGRSLMPESHELEVASQAVLDALNTPEA